MALPTTTRQGTFRSRIKFKDEHNERPPVIMSLRENFKISNIRNAEGGLSVNF